MRETIPAETPTLEPIEHTDLSEKVYRLLQEKIFAREFSPGAKLDLDALAAALHVSRTPLNNAMLRLSQDGLVRIEPRRGTFITELTAREIGEWYDVRQALDMLAAELGIRLMDDAGLRQAGEIFERLAALRHSIEVDYLEHVRLDREFHLKLVEFAHNRKLWEIYEGLHTDVINARLYYHGRLRDRAEVDKEHEAIFTAYRARDLAAAKVALSIANANAKQTAIQRIEELGGAV
ncbi:MAG: GntR family transcriptional regulator [Dehalococcoidales bacterium]|nr:GntR family transcriptional regulator [Dehalococcoidales bacterium]